MRADLTIALAVLLLAVFSLEATAWARLFDRLEGRGDGLVPHQPFESSSPPPAPDYASPAAWAALPTRADGSDVTPAGLTAADPAHAPVDVFFIHPTSYVSGESWNEPLSDETTNARTDTRSLRNQASAFNGCCRVYAPLYRQATLGAFFTQRQADADKALDLAYSDVARAFRYYIDHDNHGRPFIIASHSQGSRHALRLLQEMVDGTPLRARLVAAYLIGYAIPEDVFTRNLHTIRACARADDTGCIVSWSTYAEGSPARWSRERVDQRYATGEEPNRGKPLICLNPLSWTDGLAPAPASLNLGAWRIKGDEAPGPVRPAATGARCENGALYVQDLRGEGDTGSAGLEERLLGSGNYHVLDYQLFYMNIRDNASRRVAAFLGQTRTAGR